MVRGKGSNQFVWIVAEVSMGGVVRDIHDVCSSKKIADARCQALRDQADGRNCVVWCWQVNGDQIRDQQGL